MADNRKYYYLKLKENYFDDDSIVLLESMNPISEYYMCQSFRQVPGCEQRNGMNSWSN